LHSAGLPAPEAESYSLLLLQRSVHGSELNASKPVSRIHEPSVCNHTTCVESASAHRQLRQLWQCRTVLCHTCVTPFWSCPDRHRHISAEGSGPVPLLSLVAGKCAAWIVNPLDLSSAINWPIWLRPLRVSSNEAVYRVPNQRRPRHSFLAGHLPHWGFPPAKGLLASPAALCKNEFTTDVLVWQGRGSRGYARECGGICWPESHKHRATRLLRQIPGIGPIRAALLVALLQTPDRFRTKRQLWAYSGLAIETHGSGEYRYVEGQLRRSHKPVALRGLNKNHNHDLKWIFKSAALRASSSAGPLHEFYEFADQRNEAGDGSPHLGRARSRRSL